MVKITKKSLEVLASKHGFPLEFSINHRARIVGEPNWKEYYRMYQIIYGRARRRGKD